MFLIFMRLSFPPFLIQYLSYFLKFLYLSLPPFYKFNVSLFFYNNPYCFFNLLYLNFFVTFIHLSLPFFYLVSKLFPYIFASIITVMFKIQKLKYFLMFLHLLFGLFIFSTGTVPITLPYNLPSIASDFFNFSTVQYRYLKFFLIFLHIL